MSPTAHFPEISVQHPVAYFCAEYGLQANLPIYAGGLGILAGDTLKQAADQAFPLIGVGLLSRGFGMRQHITERGEQVDQDWEFDPRSEGLENVYLDGMPLFIKVHLTESTIWLRCWQKTLSAGVVLYLLDSDTEQNQLPDRSLTQVLYCGTKELQLKQQLLLGIGGVKLLTALGIQPSVYHVQEGRPAFLHWQLIRQLMDTHKIDFHSAHELAKQKTVYTNHTLIAAGNQSYSMDLLKVLGGYYAEKMKIPIELLLTLGIENDPTQFSVTRFALNTARKASGVSELHSQLSAQQWPEYSWTNITNGVHLPTWQSPQIKEKAADPLALWQAHISEKYELARFVHEQTGYSYDPNRLVITWARRLAGYKQMDLLFSDIPRLAAIIKNSERPVQILFSGKAHQGDTQGKAQLQKIIGYMQQELSGNALFVPNYNLAIAQKLVRGSDIWLNTPLYKQEACGTSGMKALSNGVLQCTVPDGWAAEVDWNGIGWSLPITTTAAQLYELLEKEVIPHFYTRSSMGFPEEWVTMMQKSILLSDKFSAQRMLNQYAERLYN
ncbi:alpha-glucan family phosphorylase [Candidatus Woesebacteria bacterium]|nr:alpha-glucan family phosphorylase [Candidatus Woesebacteria bacterium]